MAITDPKIDALLAAERSRQETLASDEAARAEAAEEARDAEARSDLAGDVLEESELEFQPSTPEVYEGWTSPGPGVPPLSGRVKMTSRVPHVGMVLLTLEHLRVLQCTRCVLAR